MRTLVAFFLLLAWGAPAGMLCGGDDDRADVPHSALLTTTSNIAIHVVFNIGLSNSSRCLLNKQNAGGSSANYQVNLEGGKLRVLWYGGGNWNVWRSTSVITTQTVHTLTVAHVWGNSANLKVWMDGSALAGAGSYGNLSAATTANTAPFNIGSDNATGWWSGTIYELAIWQQSLAVPEIIALQSARLYNTPLAVNSRPSAYWRFDETPMNTTITALVDRSGNGLSATNFNGSPIGVNNNLLSYP